MYVFVLGEGGGNSGSAETSMKFHLDLKAEGDTLL